MNDGYRAFRGNAIQVPEFFPELRYLETDIGMPYLAGDIVLRGDSGEYIDSYAVKIEPTEGYPFRFPRVIETGGRLPVNIDWHVYPDGYCCLMSPPEQILKCKNGVALLGFIENHVKPYFFAQKHRELYGFYLKERSHGDDGIIEFFEDIFRTKDLFVIARGLMFIKNRQEPSRTGKCFCGGSQKYRKCHRDAFRTLSAFTDFEIMKFVEVILKSKRYPSTR